MNVNLKKEYTSLAGMKKKLLLLTHLLLENKSGHKVKESITDNGFQCMMT
jgi:hypothetical protein